MIKNCNVCNEIFETKCSRRICYNLLCLKKRQSVVDKNHYIKYKEIKLKNKRNKYDPNKSKQYRENNKEKLKEYRENNKEKIRQYNKRYMEENRKSILEKQKKYYSRPEIKKIRIKKNYEYRINKLKNDIEFKIKERIRTRIWNAIKNNSKSDSTIKLLGCSISEYKKYLEK